MMDFLKLTGYFIWILTLETFDWGAIYDIFTCGRLMSNCIGIASNLLPLMMQKFHQLLELTIVSFDKFQPVAYDVI